MLFNVTHTEHGKKATLISTNCDIYCGVFNVQKIKIHFPGNIRNKKVLYQKALSSRFAKQIELQFYSEEINPNMTLAKMSSFSSYEPMLGNMYKHSKHF